jgi:hypothetical protein
LPNLTNRKSISIENTQQKDSFYMMPSIKSLELPKPYKAISIESTVERVTPHRQIPFFEMHGQRGEGVNEWN